MPISHDDNMRVSGVRDQGVDGGAGDASGAEETRILTHVQRKHLPQVGHVPRQRTWHQPAQRDIHSS